MNKEFRAWDKVCNSMVPESWKLYFNGSVSITDTWATEDIIVMQWTGLYDRNGVKVFEGDVVFIDRQDSLRSINQEVIFNPYKGFCTFRELKGFEEFQYLELGYFGEEHIKVLGNVYEHNLLEETE